MSDSDDTMKMVISMMEKILETQHMIIDSLEELGKKADLGERAYRFNKPIG